MYYIERKYFIIFRSSSANINPTNSQHPGAIYTSRPISALISTASTVNVPRKRNIEELLSIEAQNNGK